MKNFRKLLLLLVVLMSVAACKKSKTASGFEYTVHKKGDGKKAAIGDAAFYDVMLSKDDSLLFSTLKEGQQAKSLIERRHDENRARVVETT